MVATLQKPAQKPTPRSYQKTEAKGEHKTEYKPESNVGKTAYMLFPYGTMQKGIGYTIKEVGRDYYVMGGHYVPKKFITFTKPIVKVYESYGRDDRNDY